MTSAFGAGERKHPSGRLSPPPTGDGTAVDLELPDMLAKYTQGQLPPPTAKRTMIDLYTEGEHIGANTHHHVT